MRKYFGTDGVRGLVGEYPITAEFALKLGHAVGRVLRQQFSHTPTVLIGKDTRISGYMLESALEAGFVSAGVNVLLSGPLPTPGVAYLTRALRLDLGVVISASHNAYEDNGIKFFSSQGEKLSDEWELLVEQFLDQPPQWVHSKELGKAKRVPDAAGRYIEFCKSTVDKDFSMRNLKIVVDAAHGAAYHIAPDVFHELGADVVEIGTAPDGLNINKECGATHLETLQKAVIEHNADYGIALDGDADRIQIIDSSGTIYNGDQIVYVLAIAKHLSNERVEGVVGTVMTNAGIEKALKAKGIDMVRSNVGDRYILEQLNKKKWTLGGESSGHILIMDKHSTGDGIISALQVMQAIVKLNMPLVKILEDVTMQHQELINVRVPKKPSNLVLTEIEKFAIKVTSNAADPVRVLIRPSGTEPLIRVMVESEDATRSKDIAEKIANFTKLKIIE